MLIVSAATLIQLLIVLISVLAFAPHLQLVKFVLVQPPARHPSIAQVQAALWSTLARAVPHTPNPVATIMPTAPLVSATLMLLVAQQRIPLFLPLSQSVL